MGTLSRESGYSAKDSSFSSWAKEVEEDPKGKVQVDFFRQRNIPGTTNTTTTDRILKARGLSGSPNNNISRSVIMEKLRTESTIPNGSPIGKRWTNYFHIIPRASGRFSKEFTSLPSYSICILIILSTFWSTSLGMENQTTGASTFMASQSSTLSISSSSAGEPTTGPPSILARPALSPHQSQPQHNHHHHPSSPIIEGHDIIIGPAGHPHSHHHKCYVCLPTDRTSSEAQEILKIFKEKETQIPDCASFTANNKKNFEFKCPQDHPGCLLRIHGTSVSRSCARFQLNDCKMANSVEFCSCKGPLCNENKFTMFPQEEAGGGGYLETESEEKVKARLVEEKEEAESRKFWQKGETDDEDLLEMQDDTGSSGDGVDPPGVIDQYTTTPKPTLVPNLRGDSSRFKTTVPPASGASNIVPLFMMTATLICSLLVPSTIISFH